MNCLDSSRIRQFGSVQGSSIWFDILTGIGSIWEVQGCLFLVSNQEAELFGIWADLVCLILQPLNRYTHDEK